MSRLSRTANSAMLVTLLSHFLCCGLPLVVNLLALIAGLGTLSAAMPWISNLHQTMHGFELYFLVFSGIALGFGYLVSRMTAKRDCATETCHHAPCAPRKRQANWILVFAGLLFAMNLISYIWHPFG